MSKDDPMIEEFLEASNFTPEEQALLHDILDADSDQIGVNILELMDESFLDEFNAIGCTSFRLTPDEISKIVSAQKTYTSESLQEVENT